jgi:thiamine transport system substrate-binding protein
MRPRPALGAALVIGLLALMVLGACSDDQPDEVVLLTHDSFAMPQEVLDAFTEDTGVTVRVLKAGDAGAMVNQAILAKENPLADVLFGVDNTFLSRALDAGIFVPYASPELSTVPDDLEIDPEHRVTPIDVGNVCLNYDREGLAAMGLSPPPNLAALTDPSYAGRVVVQDPSTSSPGLAFLLATIAEFPDDATYTWHDYWTDLVANDVLITSGWEEAYYSAFSGGAGTGDRPIVVSYASSPPFEVIFADPRPAEAPTGVVTEGCFRQIEFAGILAGTEAEDAARQLIDFMLSPAFQDEIPLNMFVYPASDAATLPPEFLEFTTVPDAPLTLDPATIDANREAWIRAWTELVR